MTDRPYGLELSEPRLVMTRNGERYVRSAVPTKAFWDAYRDPTSKAELKKHGWSVGKNYQSGAWEVTHWAEVIPVAERIAADQASRAMSSDIEVPAPAGCVYRPFQRAGVAYALDREGTLIGDEMGLGKTIQAIGVANATGARRILVVAPATLLLNWRDEIAKWQVAKLPINIVRPGGMITTGDGWQVINYDIVGRYARELRAKAWDLVVFDEAQMIKSRSAQRTKALVGGGREKLDPIPAAKRLLLTGTPIMNHPGELFTLINYLDPVRWPNWKSFGYRYGWDVDTAHNLDELQRRLRETVMIRRLKADVLSELPAKRRQVIAINEIDDDTRDAVREELETYERNEAAVEEATYAAQVAEAEGDAAAYRAAVAKLKAAKAVAFEQVARVRHETAVRKLPYVIEHLREIPEGTKVIVFAHHLDVVAALIDAVKDRGVVSIIGSTPVAKRHDIVQAFQTDASIDFIVGNSAMETGVTLTASSHVVFAELDWTPSKISQREDRAHRIGQTDSVLVQHIVIDGSLDARMAKLLIRKQTVIDAALDAKLEPLPAATEAVTLADAVEVEAAAAPARVVGELTDDQIAATHQVLRILASMDEDRARYENGIGFNKMDTRFGCELATRSTLSMRQALAARKMVRKYQRQYPAALLTRMFPNEDANGSGR